MAISAAHNLPRFRAQSAIRVVLVEPTDSKNIGAAARAMHNLGFSDLWIVRPKSYDAGAAAATACWAKPLLDSAVFEDNLQVALAEMEDVAGFSCSYGKNRCAHAPLPEWTAEFLKTPRKTALLFGSEQNGLRSEHVALCRTLVRIPSSSDFPAFNLAQAVLLALYEVSRGGWKELSIEEQRELPTWDDFAQLDKLVEQSALQSGFYNPQTSQAVPRIISNVLRRAQPDKREMQMLLGLFARLAGERKESV